MKKLLTLYHESVPGHVETWYQNNDKVDVIGVYAHNSEREKSHTLTGLEALRQFALMTSTEGWAILDCYGWHDFVEGMNI